MRLIAQIKLLPTPEAADALPRTLETASAACNEISRAAWETGTFGNYDLQHLVYEHVRSVCCLSAQVTIRCLAKVDES